MKFSRISVKKSGVELDYEAIHGDAKEETKWSNHQPPLGSFKDAMQGLVGYVVDLIPFLSAVRETITVTTINLSEDKNGLRGLIVTATTPVEKAYGKPLVLNTPLVREGGELALDEAFVLSDEVLELIGLIEAEARRYKAGEYGEAEKPTTSENSKAADERMAAAEVASTRKPKGKRGKGKTADEPTPLSDLTDDAVRQLLATVDRDVPIEAILAFTVEERNQAIRWAELRQKEMIGQMESVFMPVEPECLLRSATPPLKADEWTEPNPVRVTDEEAKEIVAAGRAD